MTKIEYDIMNSLSKEWRILRNSYSEEYCKVADELVTKGLIGTTVVKDELYYIVTLESLDAIKSEPIIDVEMTAPVTEPIKEEITPVKVPVEDNLIKNIDTEDTSDIVETPKKVSKPRTKKTEITEKDEDNKIPTSTNTPKKKNSTKKKPEVNPE